MARSKDSALPPARSVALEVISQVLDKGRDVQAALDYQLNNQKITPQDSALCTELVYGYLRFKGRIEALLGLFLKDSSKLPKKAASVMGLAAYEMLYLDRIPVYASVDWCVGYVKKRFSLGLGKLTNAVLRNLDRMGEKAHDMESIRTKDMSDIALLAAWHSMPEWIVSSWMDAYGEERTQILLANAQKHAPLGIRVNRTFEAAMDLVNELTNDGKSIETIGYGILYPAGSQPAELKTMINDGLISRQSMASQEVLREALPETWEAPVWDCCCGRGGKTYALLEQDVDVVFASDTSRKRLLGMREEAERLAMYPPDSLQMSAAMPPKKGSPLLEDPPATILADVPCSGFGTLSRRPDVRYHRTTEGISDLIEVQKEIMENTYSLLRKGGLLVYMTCTINPDENEKQVQAFLERHPEVKLEKEWQTPDDSTYGEYFYVALLRKP
ncbi:transcription antitermination factor NusB [Halodesulfovibrio spirochaetisodalis]|uniref:SAM-dependent MTase RsmB/NOP-type domain-containing protein n=1 Tax=Halodesulfovibrio spirochaetisodalis TaxID=1560234 RepID=A0A1B7XCR5_9BACT|nr:transcription antitermination factor NusB [Halodesulfovibrio spirochaetisodalis]OBQ51743.1 hypothetical protein SP90_09065 [Halodesulfovibrio spirochaetisodalis]